MGSVAFCGRLGEARGGRLALLSLGSWGCPTSHSEKKYYCPPGRRWAVTLSTRTRLCPDQTQASRGAQVHLLRMSRHLFLPGCLPALCKFGLVFWAQELACGVKDVALFYFDMLLHILF